MRRATPSYHTTHSGRVHAASLWEIPRGGVTARYLTLHTTYRTAVGVPGGGYAVITAWGPYLGTSYLIGHGTGLLRPRNETRHDAGDY